MGLSMRFAFASQNAYGGIDRMIAPLPHRWQDHHLSREIWVIGGRGGIKGAFRNARRDLTNVNF